MENPNEVKNEDKNCIKLSKPVAWEEIQYDAIFLDLEGLTGNDLLEAEREFIASGGNAAVAELSKGYLATVAARAAKVPTEVIKALSAKDFSSITLKVQHFLLD